jgi:Zn-dependent M28 family amino/carboxypeptidase
MPVAQIGREDELLIKRMLGQGPVTIHFSFKNRVRPATQVDNVVAEIPGREEPGSVVIVGAHLDSWHPATGAQDNGTGVAAILDIARAVQSLGLRPRRTIRFILFGGEEEGFLGSNSYVKRHAADLASIDAVLVSDTGAQLSKGWYVMGRADEKQALANIEPLLAGLGSNATSPDTDHIFGTDHAGFNVAGIPTLVLWSSLEEYSKLHHQAADSFDSVVQANLVQATATTAATAYAIADSAQPLAPHDSPAQVEDMLKKVDELDDYKALKAAGVIP